MKRRRAATRLALGASVALLAFAGLGTSHAQDSLAASPSGVYVNETSNGDINVYTNTTSGDGSVEDVLTCVVLGARRLAGRPASARSRPLTLTSRSPHYPSLQVCPRLEWRTARQRLVALGVLY